MIDPATEVFLQGLARRLSRSLLQYVHESFPFTTAQEEALVPILARQVQEDQEAAARIVRFLQKNRRRPPFIGAYPMSFTTINFASLAYLLPYLVAEDERAVAEVEKAVNSMTPSEARDLVQGILDLKRRHLEELN